MLYYIIIYPGGAEAALDDASLGDGACSVTNVSK